MSPNTNLCEDRQFQEAAIEYHKQRVKDEMLNRIVMFGGDPAFVRISMSLATMLDIPRVDASRLIWPISHGIYTAAETASE